MMDFRKSPQSLIDAFEAVVPGPPAQQRKMFGYQAAFVNSNLFMGLFAESMMVRLPEEPRNQLLALEGAKVFQPEVDQWAGLGGGRLNQWGGRPCPPSMREHPCSRHLIFSGGANRKMFARHRRARRPAPLTLS
jgi:hypothetical protein